MSDSGTSSLAFVAVVAEAIWSVDPFRMGDPDTFTGEGDQDAYMRMARAAVKALERWEAAQ